MKRVSLLFALILGATQIAYSQEDVCDGLSGRALGLCTAATVGMRCDSQEPAASQSACDRVVGNFRELTGTEPPWIDQYCPCFLYSTISFGDVSSAICDVFVADYQVGYALIATQTNNDQIKLVGFDSFGGPSGRSCSVTKYVAADGINYQQESDSQLTVAQYEDCKSIALLRAMNELNIVDCSLNPPQP